MNKSSDNIPASSDCLGGTSNVTIWIVAIGEDAALLFIHQLGHPIESINFGCCCGKEVKNLETIAKYLDMALTCEKYNGLLLIGSEQAMNTLKKHLSMATHNRIIAEINDDITGKNSQEIVQKLASFMPIF